MNPAKSKPFIVIACGGTGGHLFPGLAVAEQLSARGCAVALLISPKDIDQQAVKSATGVEVFTLPAVGLQNRNYFSFAKSFWKSFRTARKIFQARPPDAVLAMGGFTSAPPILAARKFGAKTFLHESNTIPGKANRFLARFVDEALMGFPEAANQLRAKKTCVTGTPVRPQFSIQPAIGNRQSAIQLGLDPDRPTILVIGGSQGATGLNNLILSALPQLATKSWQWLHLTGPTDFEKVKAAYAALGIRAVVKPFHSEMHLALGAATACVSRSGASSLAEIAAMRLPTALVPLPTSADNHQLTNALAFEKIGAAKLLEQKKSSAKQVAAVLAELVGDENVRAKMQAALAQWHAPTAAADIAEKILTAMNRSADKLPALRMNHVLENPALAAELGVCVSPATVIKRDEPMSRHTTLRVGGPADFYIEPANETDLAAILKYCNAHAVNFFILGRGSNLLVRDGGFRGVVICLASPEFSRIEIEGTKIFAGAGARQKNVAVEAKRAGLSGVEFLEGIPGSIGGALRMNAGAMGGATFDAVETVRVMDYSGTIREMKPSEMAVEYRVCAVLKKSIALGVVFRCQPQPREEIEVRMKNYSEKRWASQPAAPSAGCLFKNPTTIPAGRLIDELGLKNTKIGGARISQEHGNFLVNDGGATAKDVLALIERLRAQALVERGIDLHTEVEVIGEP